MGRFQSRSPLVAMLLVHLQLGSNLGHFIPWKSQISNIFNNLALHFGCTFNRDTFGYRFMATYSLKTFLSEGLVGKKYLICIRTSIV